MNDLASLSLHHMDRQLPKKKFAIKQWMVLSCVLLLFFIFLISYVGLDFTTKRVDANSIRTAVVEQGTMEVTVLASGTLTQADIEWVVAQTEGIVASAHAKAGDVVTEGQLLLELENPALLSAVSQAESALLAQQAELTAKKLDLYEQISIYETKLRDLEFEYQRHLLEVNAQAKLMTDPNPPISRIEFEQNKLLAKQLKKSVAFAQARVDRRKEQINAQLASLQAKVGQMNTELERTRLKASYLTITANQTGTLQDFDWRVGQRIDLGTRVAKVAMSEKLYALLKVPAMQAGELEHGQTVKVQIRRQTVDGKVTRIDPNVKNNLVEIDVELASELPAAARPDMNVRGEVYIDIIEDTIFVNKPDSFSERGYASVFLVDRKSEYANRVSVRTGRVSSDKMQIHSGLKPGDEIILSNQQDWRDTQTLYLH